MKRFEFLVINTNFIVFDRKKKGLILNSPYVLGYKTVHLEAIVLDLLI